MLTQKDYDNYKTAMTHHGFKQLPNFGEHEAWCKQPAHGRRNATMMQ